MRHRRPRPSVAPRFAVLLLVLLAAPSVTAVAQTSTPGAGPAIPSFSHIFVIVLENREYGDVIGNPKLPYLNELASTYGLVTASFAVTHPSLPNYLALSGGDTFGVTSDCTDCFVNAPNLVDQLETAGKSWKAYMEGMPKPCFLGNQGLLYAQKHDPFIYYDDVRTEPARCDKIVPFTTFANDLADNTVPDFAWITPDQCHDLHSCADEQGDAWLKTWVPQILASSAWKDGGALFITFDEGTTNAGCCGGSGGHVATLVISPMGASGFQSATPMDHYGLLRTIEDAWGMPYLGAAASAAPMTVFFSANATPPAG